MGRISVIFLIIAVLCWSSYSNSQSCGAEKVKVGEYEYKVYETPHPYPAGSPEGKLVHEVIIKHPNASYIVVHFEKFDLAPRDYVVIKDPEGIAKHVYKGKGYKDGENFYSLSVQGDTAIIRLYSYQEVPQYYGYKIDYYAHGYPIWQKPEPLFIYSGIESICGANDYQDAICFQSSYPDEYNKSRAGIRLLESGSALCSAWLISCENHVITNNHCFDSQSGLDNIEFQFMYQRPGCNSGTAVPQLQLYGGTFLRTSSTYDYTLVIPNLSGNDPQAVFGYIQVDPRVPDIGEPMYIVGHPSGYPKKISLYSDQTADTGGVCRVQSVTEASCWGSGPDVGYYCDTEGGSSGSVVLSRNTFKAIALHHCGGCLNTGVRIIDVYNDIQASSTPLPGCSVSNEPMITYQSKSVSDDCAGGGSGDGDGRLDPGEDAVMSITLKNTGATAATNVVGVLTTSTSGVTITDDTATFPDIPGNGGTSTSQSPHFSFHVNTNVECGTTINFTLHVSYTGGSKDLTLNVLVGEVVTNQNILLSEDFTGTGGWPAQWTVINGGSTSDTWTTNNPCSRTPTSPIATPFIIADSDCAGNTAEMDEQLITPQVNFVGYNQASLEFDHYFRRYENEICDVDVRSSLTGGNWVNKLRMQGSSSPNPDHKVVDITSEAVGASNVQVRFHYYNAIYEWYWMIDNVKFVGSQPTQCLYTLCQGTAAPPGRVLNSLRISKSGNYLNLNWTPPGGTCEVSGYGIYRGTLPITSSNDYDHAYLACNYANTSYQTNIGSENYYFLVVPSNASNEGSYGKDSNGNEIPNAQNPCKSQMLTNCN
jgi:V8-like Glu-specific endopeptidase